MDKLAEYVINHSVRGACQCGKCFDAPDAPAEHQPSGHTADLIFFKVAAKEANADALRALIADHKGHHCNCDPLDGREHNYLELGGWIGDQGLALTFMGLCAITGLAQLLTPRSMFGGILGEEMEMQMAGNGLVVIQTTNSPDRATRVK